MAVGATIDQRRGAARVSRAASTVAWLCAGLLCTACSDSKRSKRMPAADAGSDASSAEDGGREVDAALADEPLAVIADEQERPWALAIDDRYVYWTTRTALRRAPLAGGPTVTLVDSTGLGSIVAARGAVFFTDGPAGTVSWIDREGGTASVIGGGVMPQGVAVDETGTVYWTSSGPSFGDGSLAKVSPGGTPAVQLAAGVVQPAGVAVDRNFVYFTSTGQSCSSSPAGSECAGGGVLMIPREGGMRALIDFRDTPMDIVANERGVYWMVSTPAQVMFATGGGGELQSLAIAPGEEAGPLAVDDEAVYWSSTHRGRVMKVPLGGGTPQAIVSDVGLVGGIAVDDEWVYVAASSAGRILRVAKDGSASEPDGPITGPCPMPLGTPEEIAATPRADTNLELLALQLERNGVTASQRAYDRVVADVTAIRDAVPELADVGYFAGDDGKQLVLDPDDKTAMSIVAGEYSAWDCLNDFYGVEALQVQRLQLGGTFVLLTLKGIYALDQLSNLYGQLPGIESVGSNVGGGDGPTICARRSADGMDRIEYVIDRAGGDCPAGCNTHDARLFESTAPGVVEAIDSWTTESGSNAPAWLVPRCGRR